MDRQSRGVGAPDGESAAAMRERLSAWLAEALATAEAERHRRILAVAHGGVIRELRRRFETVDFWEGSVGQAEGRCWSLAYSEGEWQCSCSSAVPTPASATS
nr:histidine phosphatase family protein [Halomonas elongata]